jgi:Tol biopolymer transport system component
MASPLTPDRWSRVAELYDAAAALPKDQRTPFLSSACVADPALIAEIESLIAQDDVASPIDSPVWMPDDLLMQPAALAVGATVGPYVIEGLLGTGGMGEVYRAKDTRLGRRVALKVLPEGLSDNPDRRARLQREAQVLAALNHPHIAVIYGFEDRDATYAIALELVEGSTLAERLTRGPIPVEEAIAIARQIVDALDAAHDIGVIHRDLKPSNIKTRPDGTVKVLDFGLARLAAGQIDIVDVSDVPADPVTSTPSALMGTVAYMSPEQASGRAADARSDVWAFGCVFYEMLTGRRAFPGEDVTETLTVLSRAEPDWNALPTATPLPIRRLLERCLQKDRKRRLAAIADARWHLDEARHAVERPRRYGLLPWIVATASAVVAVALLAYLLRGPADVAHADDVVQFTIDAPDDVSFGGLPAPGSGNAAQLAVSPDGQKVVFVGMHAGAVKLWLRPLGSVSSTPIAGTDGAAFPFWSPDSRVVGFFADRKLKTVSLEGGMPVVLCDVLAGRGGSWSRDNVIIFSALRIDGLQRVSSAGGAPVAVTSLESGEDAHRWPFFLPDGRHFVYTAISGPCCPPAKPSLVKIGSLDAAAPTQTLMQAESAVSYAAGHLFFGRDGSLFAQPFDVERRALLGPAVPVAEHVGWEGSRYVSASMSDSGTLVYSETGVPNAVQISWYDRTGTLLGTLAPNTTYNTLALSPDEKHVAVSMRSQGLRDLDIYVLDVASGSPTRLTSDPGDDRSPAWSPDGLRIVFEREADNVFSLRQVSLGGSSDESLADDGGRYMNPSWSPDGRFIAFTRAGASGSSDVWLLPLFGERRPYPVVQSAANETSGILSPDGRWIAFVSDETGRPNVFIQPFPHGGGRRQISRESGSHPVWRADGKELFYVADGPSLSTVYLAVPIDSAGRAGEATELFRGGLPRFSDGQVYGVSNDGQRILGGGGAGSGSTRELPTSTRALRVLLNWPTALRRRQSG